MKNFMVNIWVLFLVGSGIYFSGCINRSYPCPAYTKGQSPNPNVAMVIGPDGRPLSTAQVKKDKNGLVTKKKIARIHK